MKREADGSLSPYELSINFLDALRNPDREETPTLEVARFAAAHAVAMALPGVPAIYLHSLLGSRGAPHLAKATGMPRSINREKLDAATVQRELDDPTSLRARTLHALRTLLRARRVHPAFNPSAPSRVAEAPNGVFALERGADARVIAVHELAGRRVTFDLDTPGHDLLSGERLQPGTLELEPYAVRWVALT